jgi:hypothetical protein
VTVILAIANQDVGVGRDVRDALADLRVTGTRLLPVLVPRRAGVDDLVARRLLLGDPAAPAGPARDVVDAYARLVEHLLERVPAAAGPRSERRAEPGEGGAVADRS